MNEAELLRELLNASNCPNEAILSSLLNAVSKMIPSKMCSLWKVNNRSRCVSLYAAKNYFPQNNDPDNFVHSIDSSLKGYVINEATIRGCEYIDIPSILEPPYINLHRYKDRVKELGLKRFIGILIPNYDKLPEKMELDAILNIYPEDENRSYFQFPQIIRDQFSLAISRARLLSREELTRMIMEVYERRASKDLSSVLYPIIHNILPKYIRYEGCSVFLWDPFYNRLSLSQTTGILEKPKKSDVYYYLSEGLTGQIAKNKEPVIVCDLNNITDGRIKRNYTHKWREETNHQGKSFMAIPIMSPSRPNDLVGVIRFTNRLNPLAPIVDYFSNQDLQLVQHACNMIALYMEYEQSQRVRTAFAMQMAHEMLTPAVGIRASAHRLLKKKNSPSFSEGHVNSYLSDIYDHAELQVALTKTIEFLWKGSSGYSKANIYRVNRHNLLRDVIQPSIKIVIPIARQENLRFDNIVTSGDFPFLHIDKYAFRQVFFNLLTNAIKYRNLNSPKDFCINIESKGMGIYEVPQVLNEEDFNEKALIGTSREIGFLINIEDMGVGIDGEDTSRIFILGYRKKGIEKTSVRGLGIGLTVVRKILNDFGCTIWVDHLKYPTRLSVFLAQKLSDSQYLKSDEWLTN